MSRRLAFLALALVTLLAAASPTVVAKPKKQSGPKVTRFSPSQPEIGGNLTLFGKGFAKKRSRNTVVLRSPKGGTTFLKPIGSGKGKLVVRLPNTIERLMAQKSGATAATRFRVRVLAGKRFGPWTKGNRSPVIQPSGASPGVPADCDQDGAENAADPDDDNDLLEDTLEAEIKTDVCIADTDGDAIEDGFEYTSALNLNNDEDQEPNSSLPYPGKRPYPNPLDPSDPNKDFDRDVLTQAEEHTLWRYAIKTGSATRTLTPMYYSDGEQYSINTRVQGDRRQPALLAAGYDKQVSFLDWAAANGYRTVMLEDGAPWWDHANVRNSYGLLDFNRDSSESTSPPAGYYRAEATYYDFDQDGYLSDNERDEDADGLTNYDEQHGRMTPDYWAACYSESPHPIDYMKTDFVDPDTDGDGVRDGADDQDHDDIPSVMELSRNAGSGLDDTNGTSCKAAEGLPVPPDTHHPTAYGRVNPFNPCLPAVWSRTCDQHPGFGGSGAPFDNSPNWYSLN